jgi:hypothetical protein
MKIKLQDYGLINIKMMDDMIKELEGFKTGDILKDLPTRSLIGTLEGLKQQLIPAEISDEEIEKAAENYGWRIKTNTFSDPVKANELAQSAKQDFMEGAKWYREQLKRNK